MLLFYAGCQIKREGIGAKLLQKIAASLIFNIKNWPPKVV
jgi:hypothetical protein